MQQIKVYNEAYLIEGNGTVTNRKNELINNVLDNLWLLQYDRSFGENYRAELEHKENKN
ncbi:hypothetical protein [Cellulosilyticum ruminicola]|uniref:hypothetical protein n=1 Tax=Cellulosilyticum ruminicola TaxID=425254 RepID=UPI0012ED8C29|nr:hypothetical protein [Cellulosilyticum ruminicola]